MITIYTSSFSNITLCLFCITLCLFRSSVTKTKRCQFCMNLITIKNLSRHELKCEQRSFLGGSLQQDHEESFAAVDQPDPNIENTSLEESDESDVINEGNAEGSDNDFNIKSDPEDGVMGASDKILILFCIFVSYWQMTYGISDRATAALLTFIKQFVHVLSKDSNNIEAISLKMPKTLYSLNKIIGNKDQPFTEFVACSMRYKLLKFSESWQKLQGVNISKKCSNKLYPDHTQKSKQGYCNEKFLELVKNPSGKTESIPFKKYCYVPLIDTIKTFLSRQGLEEKSELWRQRDVPKGTMCDVYDGQIWADFNDANKFDFFTKPRKYG